MRLTVNSKYRRLTRIVIWILSVGSIAIAMCTIPPFIAIIVAVLCVLIPFLIDRIIFKYNIIWIYPEITNLFFNRLGTTWFRSDLDEENLMGIGILFERKSEAKDAYSILRSWNYYNYIDREGNISVNFIDEGENRYSVFIYPGDRKLREDQLLYSLKNEYPHNSVFDINTKVFIWTQSCGDYSDRPEMLAFFKKVKESGKILLNTTYVVNDLVKSYAKKSICVKKIRFISRGELTCRDLENTLKWEDPIKKFPENAKRVSRIKINAGVQTLKLSGHTPRDKHKT